jgi:hypothetical protein
MSHITAGICHKVGISTWQESKSDTLTQVNFFIPYSERNEESINHNYNKSVKGNSK